jgi:membrane-associated phospholipid phosphatase
VSAIAPDAATPGALLTARDGIVGTWRSLSQEPRERAAEDGQNLKLWGPRERAELVDFELQSRLAFSFEPAAAGPAVATFHHLSPQAALAPAPFLSMPIVRMTRPTKAQFVDQLVFVNNYADLRADRASEIFAQLGVPAAFFGSIAQLDANRTPKTLELLFGCLRFALYIEMRTKHAMACRRPHEYSPQIQPLIAVPNHSTWPSGHATEAFVFAFVFSSLLKATGNPIYGESLWTEQMMRLASRIAINRTVAGVHFPIDSAVGAMLGLTLGEYLVARFKGGTKYKAWHFRSPDFSGDFNWRKFYTVGAGQTEASVDTTSPKYAVDLGFQTFGAGDGSPILAWLWGEAIKEWEPLPQP